jgi:hypothetical protein
MKNLTNILRRSNISPKERILAVVQNEIYKEKNGKGALSESEIHALSHGWNPKDSHEAKEYNRYLEAFKLERSMRIDARMFAYRLENFLLRSNILVNYTMNLDRNIEDFKRNDSLNKVLPQEEIINFAIKNTYIDHDKLVHIMTFNNLPKEVKDDLLLLDEYASYDGKYLEDEVFLFEIFKKSKTLDIQDKNIIVDRIFSCIYREGFRKFKNGSEKDNFMIFHSFAELPMSKVFEKWAEYANINFDESDNNIDAQYLVDKFEEYAKSKNKSMKTIMKETISKWIDEGLFVSEYTPIFFSNRNDTWNGNTKLTHKEIFIKWHTQLQKTKSFIDKLISNGDIEVKFIDKEILDTTKKIKVVTGESLYRSKINIDFVKEYKEQISILSPVIGLFLFVPFDTRPLSKQSRTWVSGPSSFQIKKGKR